MYLDVGSDLLLVSAVSTRMMSNFEFKDTRLRVVQLKLGQEGREG